MISLSSRVFNQDISYAKRQSLTQPVIVTDRGTPTHVLLNYTAYQTLLSTQPSVVDLLSLDNDIDFHPAKARINIQAASTA